jgi:hypothetical protein
VWPQQEERLLAKYKPTGTYDGPWRKYVPDPKQQGFFASPAPHDFVLHTSYGVMHGKKGDYVLKVRVVCAVSAVRVVSCRVVSCGFLHVFFFFFDNERTTELCGWQCGGAEGRVGGGP